LNYIYCFSHERNRDREEHGEDRLLLTENTGKYKKANRKPKQPKSVFKRNGKWNYWDETGLLSKGYNTKTEAETALKKYTEWLKSNGDQMQAEEVSTL